MLSRPVDSSGDILPVQSSADLLSGPASVASGLRDHLNLFPGDWWEYPSRGNPVFDLIPVSRRTSQDADTLSSALCAYLRQFPGVRSLSEVQASFLNHSFSFFCTVHTEGEETVPVFFTAP